MRAEKGRCISLQASQSQILSTSTTVNPAPQITTFFRCGRNGVIGVLPEITNQSVEASYWVEGSQSWDSVDNRSNSSIVVYSRLPFVRFPYDLADSPHG